MDLRPDALRRGFFALLAASLALRFWLAGAAPFTGDEAYFFYWGTWPDWGFYDHPPMVGWLLALLQRISLAEWVLRLPMVLQPAILALSCVWLLRRDPDIAWLAGCLVLLVPAHLWNVAITTDTPLVYFSFFSGLAFLRAARDDDPRFYLLAGVLLGGAFLSKYFAALLGVAYFCHVLLRPSRRKWLGFAWLLAGAAPALALNLWWNWGHCWANLMFNLYNRHEGAGLSWTTPLLYAATLLYLLTPPALLALRRGAPELARQWWRPERRALALVALVPLGLFAALSLVKTIGMHWLLSFVPFFILLLAGAVPRERLPRLYRFFLGFAALHVVAIAVVSQLPLETWRDNPLTRRIYPGLVMTVKPHEVLAPLAPYGADYAFAANGYSPAVTLSFNARRYFFVFGEASAHARHDDIVTDFRALDGRNILVWRKDEPNLDEYLPYFREVEAKTYAVRGAAYYLVLGRGFDYARYRDQVLTRVRERYYAIPRYLPSGRCYFCERYFPGTQCRK